MVETAQRTLQRENRPDEPKAGGLEASGAAETLHIWPAGTMFALGDATRKAMDVIAKTAQLYVSSAGDLGRCCVDLMKGIGDRNSRAIDAFGRARTPADVAAAEATWMAEAFSLMVAETAKAQDVTARIVSGLFAELRRSATR